MLARQLLKSGTSIGANIQESQNAESTPDFIHKLKLAAKEADETQYWLQLCQKSENYPNPETLLKQLESIKKLLNTIIATMKRKTNK
jgi:four helix bundle protein